jgi:hypothetical protein
MESPNNMKPFKLNEQLPVSRGFAPDEQYFRSMQEQVWDKLDDNGENPKVIPLYRRLWIPAAAAVLLVFMMLTFTWGEKPDEEMKDNAAIENYLTSGMLLSQYDIASQLTEADIDMLEADLALDDLSIENALLQNPNIEQYLLN